MEAGFEDPQFLELVMVFQQAAWQALGKIANPVNGKTETDLPQARHAIDMLAMLERKMAGNLTDQEQRFLANALTQLRLNYVDTVGQKPPDSAAEPAEEPSGEDSETPG